MKGRQIVLHTSAHTKQTFSLTKDFQKFPKKKILIEKAKNQRQKEMFGTSSRLAVLSLSVSLIEMHRSTGRDFKRREEMPRKTFEDFYLVRIGFQRR